MHSFILYLFIVNLTLYTAGGAVCQADKKETDYRGCANRDYNGQLCQKWSSQYPHKHSFYGINGAGDHNYCRNPDPDHEKNAWCFLAQRDGGSGRTYCDVKIDKGTCFTDPAEDPTCPNYSRKEEITPKKRTEGGKGKVYKPDIQPTSDMQAISATAGGDLVLDCNPGQPCSTATWSEPSGGGSFLVYSNGSLFLSHIQSRHAGVWTCSCGGVSRKYTVKVVQNAQQTEVVSPNSNSVVRPSADSQAIQSEECSGGKCGICVKNPVACACIVGGGVCVIIAIAAYIRQRNKWRQAEARFKFSHSRGDTCATQRSATVETYKMRSPPKEPHYEKALQLKESLALAEDAQRQHSLVPHRPSLAQIRCNGIESQDDIICSVSDSEYTQERGSQEELVVYTSGTRLTGKAVDVRSKLKTWKTEDVPVFGRQETMRRVVSPAVSNMPIYGSQVTLPNTVSGVTVFDKYYDEQVDTWSIDSKSIIQV